MYTHIQQTMPSLGRAHREPSHWLVPLPLSVLTNPRPVRPRPQLEGQPRPVQSVPCGHPDSESPSYEKTRTTARPRAAFSRSPAGSGQSTLLARVSPSSSPDRPWRVDANDKGCQIHAKHQTPGIVISYPSPHAEQRKRRLVMRQGRARVDGWALITPHAVHSCGNKC